MSKNEQVKFWGHLTEFFCSNEGLSKNEVRKELEADGIDVDDYLANVHSMVRRSLQAEWRKRATLERSLREKKSDRLLEDVAVMNTEQLMLLISDARDGKYGPTGQELAIACRNESCEQMQPEDLKALAHDILQSSDGVEEEQE